MNGWFVPSVQGHRGSNVKHGSVKCALDDVKHKRNPRTDGRLPLPCNVSNVSSLSHGKMTLGEGIYPLLKQNSKGPEELPRYYASIVESSDDAIIGKSLDGTIQSWNSGAERIFGYPADEVIGKSILILFPPDKLDEESEILGRIKRGERIEHYETLRVRKDGKLIHISVTVSPLKDADGVIVGASKIARDITDRKEAEEALKNAQGRYKQTLDQLLEGCQIIDFDWRYVYINDVGASHSRLREEDLLGRTMMEVYPGIENTDMFGMLRDSMVKRIPHRMENLFVYEDGSDSAWFNLSVEPVPEGILSSRST